MKSALASLKPYYYYLVGEDIKKIEVRKSEPKADDWNRETYFYMSKDEKSFAKIPKEYQDKYRKHFGKVGLKFVCDRIDTFMVCRNGAVRYRNCYDLEKSCLTYNEISNYVGKGKFGYAWYISDLKIYDKPKDLSEFRKCCHGIGKCSNCLDNVYWGGNCDGGAIEKAPQSWGYCKELEK